MSGTDLYLALGLAGAIGMIIGYVMGAMVVILYEIRLFTGPPTARPPKEGRDG